MENVTFVEPRRHLVWGGWNMVGTVLDMLASLEANLQSGDFVTLLSGDSFPTQPQQAIEGFLGRAGVSVYMECSRMPSPESDKPITRLSHYYLAYDRPAGISAVPAKLVNRVGVPRRYKQALSGRIPYSGSQWWTLSAEVVAWVLDEVRRDPRYVRLFARTMIPDEMFFQTLLGNSRWSAEMGGSLLYSDWARPGVAHPAIIDEGHIQELRAARLVGRPAGSPALFVRKVHDARTAGLIRGQLWPLIPGQKPAL